MAILSARLHAVLDYGMAIFLFTSPWLFGFETSVSATAVMKTMGITIVFLSLVTKYPLGLIKIIPFPVHGVLETLGSVGLLSSPWLFHFADTETPRGFAIIVAIAYFSVIALTNYTSYHERKLTH